LEEVVVNIKKIGRFCAADDNAKTRKVHIVCHVHNPKKIRKEFPKEFFFVRKVGNNFLRKTFCKLIGRFETVLFFL